MRSTVAAVEQNWSQPGLQVVEQQAKPVQRESGQEGRPLVCSVLDLWRELIQQSIVPPCLANDLAVLFFPPLAGQAAVQAPQGWLSQAVRPDWWVEGALAP